MKWLRSIFQTKDQRRREKALFRLEELQFFRYTDETDAVSSREDFVKHGGSVFDLFRGTGRLFSALYKETQRGPWIKALLADTRQVLKRHGINLAVKREMKKCRTIDRNTGEYLDVMRPVGAVVDIDDHDSEKFTVVEDFSISKHMIKIGRFDWLVWDQKVPVKERSILERQRVLDIYNDLLVKCDSQERLWHCWGEKGGESLFIFLTPEMQSLIKEEKIINDHITSEVTQPPPETLG